MFIRATGFLCLALAFFLCSALAQGMGRSPARYSVGVRSLAVLTSDNARLGVMLWYPTRRNSASYHTSFGIWVLRAEKNVAPAPLLAPVILISHDMVDTNISQHEIASALASAGFIVIAPSHTGDSIENASAAYSAASLYYRPLQIREALDAVLEEPDFEGLLDTRRIGLLGSGAGALTVLQLCGVDLDYGAYARYCDSAGNDEALCSAWARSRMSRVQSDMAEIRSRRGRKAFAAPLPNVKAVGVLSPGWLSLADKNDVSAPRVPVAALFAGQGGLYPPVESGEDVLELFPRPLYDSVSYQVLVEADHFSLRSECPPELLRDMPGICGRLSGIARDRLREKRDAYFVSFFQAVLGLPLPAPL
jgi:predicted dienelactone hydrolase